MSNKAFFSIALLFFIITIQTAMSQKTVTSKRNVQVSSIENFGNKKVSFITFYEPQSKSGILYVLKEGRAYKYTKHGEFLSKLRNSKKADDFVNTEIKNFGAHVTAKDNKPSGYLDCDKWGKGLLDSFSITCMKKVCDALNCILGGPCDCEGESTADGCVNVACIYCNGAECNSKYKVSVRPIVVKEIVHK